MKLLFISVAAALYLFRLYSLPQYQISLDQPVKIIGRITEQPYHKDSYQIIKVGPITAITDRFPGYFYGERLQIVGKFEKRLTSPFTPQYFTYFPTIQEVEESQSPSINLAVGRFFLNTRGQIETKIAALLPEPEGSLLLGIVFGVKTQMPQQFWQNLRKTGTLHLVVASGQNVAIVAGFLIEVLVLIMKRRRAIILTFLGILVYVLMVGSQPPIVRAAIMALAAFTAQFFGREGEGMGLLLAAAIIMLLVSPLILFDIGFQLSFAATAGIILIYPKIWLKFRRLPILGEGLATTLAAQIATLPILLTNFGMFSFISPLVNALVLPTIPFMMSLGGILAIVSLIVTPIAQLLSWFIWPILKYFVIVVESFGAVAWAIWEVGKLNLLWAVGYYLVLGIIWRKARHEGSSPT